MKLETDTLRVRVLFGCGFLSDPWWLLRWFVPGRELTWEVAWVCMTPRTTTHLFTVELDASESGFSSEFPVLSSFNSLVDVPRSSQ